MLTKVWCELGAKPIDQLWAQVILRYSLINEDVWEASWDMLCLFVRSKPSQFPSSATLAPVSAPKQKSIHIFSIPRYLGLV